jgi:hypothetical protein
MKEKSDFKQKIRGLGIDDGAFTFQDNSALLVAVLVRADGRVEGIQTNALEVDGTNSTKKIIELVRTPKTFHQASVLFLSGINFAGFNVVDVSALAKKIPKPIIVVFRRKPALKKIFTALKKFSDAKKRKTLIKKAGPIYKAKNIFFQCHNTNPKTAKQLIERFSLFSHLPEPVRLAHLIASGVSLGKNTRPK